ncbi:MAG: TldD/PmbA family protein [Nitrospirae bacterium]|nr:TldD/PmbA family protein [Nitrospirota bacterium]
MADFAQLDLPRILGAALRNGGEYGDLFYEHTRSTTLSSEQKRIERALEAEDAGAGVRVLLDGCTHYAYTNDVTEKGLLAVADAVAESIKAKRSHLDLGMDSKPAEVGHSIRRRPDEIPLEDKAKVLRRADERAWSRGGGVAQVRVSYGDVIREIAVYNSQGRLAQDRQVRVVLAVQVVARKDELVHTGYEAIGGLVGFELFDEKKPEEVADRAAHRALLGLTAAPAPKGKMPVVISSEAGGTMIHEAVGHGLEADLSREGLSVYKDRVGEKVASELITVVDDATLANKRGSFAFDDEGTPAQRKILIEKGVLKGYMTSVLYALRDGETSTGNGRRQSYRYKPIVRMTNTFIAPGPHVPDEILRSTDRGLFVRKMGGGQVNTVNGDFIFEVMEGYRIEKGKVGEPVRGATLVGNGPEVIRIIDRVGNDLGFGIGTCGKDGQGVPVSDAMPSTRIPELVVGGAAD